MIRCVFEFCCTVGQLDAVAATSKRQRRGQEPNRAVWRVEVFDTVGKPLPTSFNSGMSLQTLMALLGHVSTEMSGYAGLAPAVRTAYEEAMSKARLTLAIAPVGQPIIPGRIEWLRAEMLKTRVAHGYCSRQLTAEACPYANICEQCDNYVTARSSYRSSRPSLLTSPRSATTPPGAAGTPRPRHSRVTASLQAYLHRLKRNQEPDIKGDLSRAC